MTASIIEQLRKAFDPDGEISDLMDEHAEQARAAGPWIRFTCFACPTQAEGTLSDGRMFYFRARHGDWRLAVSHEPGGDAVDGKIIAEGDDLSDGFMPPNVVVDIVLTHLGDRTLNERPK